MACLSAPLRNQTSAQTLWLATLCLPTLCLIAFQADVEAGCGDYVVVEGEVVEGEVVEGEVWAPRIIPFGAMPASPCENGACERQDVPIPFDTPNVSDRESNQWGLPGQLTEDSSETIRRAQFESLGSMYQPIAKRLDRPPQRCSPA